MCRNIFATLHGVIIRLGKPHFEQSVRGYPFLFHSLKQWFIANHKTTSTAQTIFCICGIEYLRKKTYNPIMEVENMDEEVLTPSYHGELCRHNGNNPDYEIACDECDYYLTCFPDWEIMCNV